MLFSSHSALRAPHPSTLIAPPHPAPRGFSPTWDRLVALNVPQI